MRHDQEDGEALVSIVAVGDLMVNRDDPASAFEHVGALLRAGDITFGQLETPYSDKGSAGSSGPRGPIQHGVANYAALPAGGFDVISLASNHIMDWGQDALLDLMERMRRDGIEPVGAGRDLTEARRAVYFDRAGRRIACLGYCSVAPSGYYAVDGRAGVAPMRALTHYQPVEDDQPGTPCDIMTMPVARDLDDLVADVRAAKERSDVVVLSMHWGVHFARAVIADYQREVGHAAVDAGADIVIGHHPHILKGVEIYQGRVILYSLGNFVFDFREQRTMLRDPAWDEARLRVYRQVYGMPSADPDSKYRFQADAKYSMIVKAELDGGTVGRVSFVPVVINRDATPEPVSPTGPPGREVLDYMIAVGEEAGLNARYRVEGDEVVICS